MATKKKSRKKSARWARHAKKTSTKARVNRKSVTKKAAAKGRKPKKIIRRGRGFAAKSEIVGSVVYEDAGRGPRSGGQSGDLQGLSDRRRAGAESVDELLEEGNAFEAGVVKGVEDVQDEEEVRTHEVPEDDVPDEYLDKD